MARVCEYFFSLKTFEGKIILNICLVITIMDRKSDADKPLEEHKSNADKLLEEQKLFMKALERYQGVLNGKKWQMPADIVYVKTREVVAGDCKSSALYIQIVVAAADDIYWMRNCCGLDHVATRGCCDNEHCDLCDTRNCYDSPFKGIILDIAGEPDPDSG